jgi:hypothetical protein
MAFHTNSPLPKNQVKYESQIMHILKTIHVEANVNKLDGSHVVRAIKAISSTNHRTNKIHDGVGFPKKLISTVSVAS